MAYRKKEEASALDLVRRLRVLQETFGGRVVARIIVDDTGWAVVSCESDNPEEPVRQGRWSGSVVEEHDDHPLKRYTG